MIGQASSLVVRRDAAQATMDAFRGKEFAWGKTDCVRVAAFHLRMLGYQPKLSRGGSYTSELGAVRALKRAGFKSLEAALSSLGLAEIGYASALVGDLYLLKSDGDWPSIGVGLGNGVVLAAVAELGKFWPTRPRHETILGCRRADPCRRR